MTKNITLALQGGGAHGAFTWGVLDRLLEEPGINITGISGTSAGAMNAAVLADGYEKSGVNGAKDALENFWKSMSEHGKYSPYRSFGLDAPGNPNSPITYWLDNISRITSPYEWNPLDINPLREVLNESIDFEALRRCKQIKLYVCATNVKTNRLRVFTSEQMSAEVLLASACLPQVHHAVEVNGEFYWDGGFIGNPVLEPLLHKCKSNDIVIVQINPTHCDTVPKTAPDIMNRLNEITFNSSLMREIRTIANINKLVEKGIIQDPNFAKINLHRISAEDLLKGLGVQSKSDTDWKFLTGLRDKGRACAEQWWEEHSASLGKESTLDLEDWQPTY